MNGPKPKAPPKPPYPKQASKTSSQKPTDPPKPPPPPPKEEYKNNPSEIVDEDLKYCNEFLQFEYHIGGYDKKTGIRKPLIGVQNGTYVNKNQKQVDEEGMQRLYDGLTLPRFAILAALNDKLREHSIKLDKDCENADEEIAKLQNEIAKLKNGKRKKSKNAK